MRAWSTLSAAVAVLMLGSCVTAADELIWKDLFAPPYQQCPEITLGISCVSKDLCFIPGGSNGVGFGMYQFNGQVNGNLIQMNEPNMTMMIMTAAMGGTTANPVGAFGGVGFGTVSVALQYLVNGSTWQPSTTPPEFVWTTQSMASTDDGQHIISLGAGTSATSIMHSDDAGKTFTSIPLTVPLLSVNCTNPNYASMVSDKIWFVTLGGYPGEHKQNNGGSSSHGGGSSSSFGGAVEDLDQPLHKSGHYSSIVRNPVTDRIYRKIHKKASRIAVDKCGYTGQVAMTTDAGKTWTNVYTTTEYTLEQIDCISATHCVVTGYGMTTDNVTKTLVLTMDDGKTWKKSLDLLGSPVSFQAVQFADAKEVWLGGGYETQTASAGVFYVSQDGGNTWKQNGGFQPNLELIMDISFTSSGVGFAVAMSEFKTSTVLRYEKQSFNGWFTQSNCPLANCTFLCQNMTFPQGMCLPVQGGSAQAFCTKDSVVQRFYETTSCVGSYNSSSMPINSCLNSTQGGFFVNYCNTSGLDHPTMQEQPTRFLGLF